MKLSDIEKKSPLIPTDDPNIFVIRNSREKSRNEPKSEQEHLIASIASRMHERSPESHDEYRGMKVYQFEMNSFEIDVARAAIRMLHKHHEFFYRMEMSTESSIGVVMEALIESGIEAIEDVEKMMEEMQHESML